ncbi:DNA-directed RNA polymerase subunit delta [Mesobacillus maritimus]|nr:DNA-directed RNA polymerase subunit delta [Mesobacillus maritimus]MCM3586848.1 DNA-directed RNA polymerase subunit delta [Mesobacillus maritimus]
MSLNQYSKEELNEMSWIEIAYQILLEKKQAVSFAELVAEVKKVLELGEDDATEKVVQFYTDLNIDGRYLGLGDNRWGLRAWYPVDQAEEDTITPVKPRKKKAKKKAVDEEVEGFDELDEEEDFDDFDEEDDLLDEDLDDFDEEDEEEEEDFDDDDDIIEDEDELELDEEELDDEEDEDLDDEEEDR